MATRTTRSSTTTTTVRILLLLSWESTWCSISNHHDPATVVAARGKNANVGTSLTSLYRNLSIYTILSWIAFCYLMDSNSFYVHFFTKSRPAWRICHQPHLLVDIIVHEFQKHFPSYHPQQPHPCQSKPHSLFLSAPKYYPKTWRLPSLNNNNMWVRGIITMNVIITKTTNTRRRRSETRRRSRRRKKTVVKEN